MSYFQENWKRLTIRFTMAGFTILRCEPSPLYMWIRLRSSILHLGGPDTCLACQWPNTLSKVQSRISTFGLDRKLEFPAWGQRDSNFPSPLSLFLSRMFFVQNLTFSSEDTGFWALSIRHGKSLHTVQISATAVYSFGAKKWSARVKEARDDSVSVVFQRQMKDRNRCFLLGYSIGRHTKVHVYICFRFLTRKSQQHWTQFFCCDLSAKIHCCAFLLRSDGEKYINVNAA